MARPREFDRDKALLGAMQTFWTHGYAATSTDDLLRSMSIQRQSLYNAFGDKRTLYLEAFALYLQKTAAAHLKRLGAPKSPLKGISELLTGLNADDDRRLGCMGVCSIGEVGQDDAEVAELREKASRLLTVRLADRIREGQLAGEIDATVDPDRTAGYVQMNMNGLQIAARAGASASDLRAAADFVVDRLKAH